MARARTDSEKFVKAFKDFLDRRDPNLSGAAYEMSLTFRPEELRDFITLFEMTFGYHNEAATNDETVEHVDIVMITNAMMNAAEDTRKIIYRS